MSKTNQSVKFPKIVPTTKSPTNRDREPSIQLTGVLASLLGHESWDGVPSPKTLGAALSKAFMELSADHSPFRNRQRNRLIGAVIDALQGGTVDGWRLELKGKKGPRRTFASDEVTLEIGLLVADEIESGAGYEAAIAAATANFSCSRTTAAQAYQDHKRAITEVEEMGKILVQNGEVHLARLRKGETKSPGE